MYYERQELIKWTYEKWSMTLCCRKEEHKDQPTHKMWILHLEDSGAYCPVAYFDYEKKGKSFVTNLVYIAKEIKETKETKEAIPGWLLKSAKYAAKKCIAYDNCIEASFKLISKKFDKEVEGCKEEQPTLSNSSTLQPAFQ